MVVARDSVVTLSTRLFIFGLSFAGNVLLARFLGASGMGIWAVMISFLSLLIHICGPGIAYANVYYGAQGKHTAGQAWAATLLLGFGFGVLAILTGVAFVLLKFRSLANIGDKRLVLALLLALPLMLTSTWGIKIIQGMNRISLMNLLDIISQSVYLVLVLVFVVIFKRKLWGSVIAYVGWHLSAVIALIVTLAILMKQGEFRLRWEAIRSNFTYGVKMYVGKLSNWTNNRIDMLIAPLFLSNALIGQYTMAVAITEKLWMIPDSLSQAVFPKISADAKGRPELTAQACRTALIVMLPVALFLIIFGRLLFRILLGPEFRGSYILMLAILPGTMAFGIGSILVTSLAGTNRPAILSVVVAIAAASNILFNFLLVPWLGVIGCSLASTGSYTLQMILLGWCHCHYHETSFSSLFTIKRSDLRFLFNQSKHLLATTLATARNKG